jgi:hypothetical protein
VFRPEPVLSQARCLFRGLAQHRTMSLSVRAEELAPPDQV